MATLRTEKIADDSNKEKPAKIMIKIYYIVFTLLVKSKSRIALKSYLTKDSPRTASDQVKNPTMAPSVSSSLRLTLWPSNFALDPKSRAPCRLSVKS